jgi:DNA invertase Pin-like site-specific DNA recombinase
MGKLNMKVAIYVRVSTKSQSVDMQLVELEEVAAKSNWVITKVYKDEGYSGSLSSNDRPAMKSLLQDAIRKKFDMVLVWSIDRLARSTANLVQLMMDLHQKGINLYVHKQAIDTSTPSGRMMWQLLGVFAEFEREMIRDRVVTGLERAKEKGVRLGRPPISDDVKNEILRLRAEGLGMVKIGRLLGVGTSQVQKLCK